MDFILSGDYCSNMPPVAVKTILWLFHRHNAFPTEQVWKGLLFGKQVETNDHTLDMLFCCSPWTKLMCFILQVQGMSFLAAVLLLNMEPSDAFICFANLLNKPCQLAFFRIDHPMVRKGHTCLENTNGNSWKNMCCFDDTSRKLNNAEPLSFRKKSAEILSIRTRKRERWLQRRQERRKFTYLTMKNSNFARFARAFFIVCIFLSRACQMYDEKWPVLQSCGQCQKLLKKTSIFSFLFRTAHTNLVPG